MNVLFSFVSTGVTIIVGLCVLLIPLVVLFSILKKWFDEFVTFLHKRDTSTDKPIWPYWVIIFLVISNIWFALQSHCDPVKPQPVTKSLNFNNDLELPLTFHESGWHVDTIYLTDYGHIDDYGNNMLGVWSRRDSYGRDGYTNEVVVSQTRWFVKLDCSDKRFKLLRMKRNLVRSGQVKLVFDDEWLESDTKWESFFQKSNNYASKEEFAQALSACFGRP